METIVTIVVCLCVAIGCDLARAANTLEYRLVQTQLPHLQNIPGVHVGRLEAEIAPGEWGTVCSSNFGLDEAHAACKSVVPPAFNLEKAYPIAGLVEYGKQTRIFLSNVRCGAGPATTLRECEISSSTLQMKNNNCTHADDVGIICVSDRFTTDVASSWTASFSAVHESRFSSEDTANKLTQLFLNGLPVTAGTSTIMEQSSKWATTALTPTGDDSGLTSILLSSLSFASLLKADIYNIENITAVTHNSEGDEANIVANPKSYRFKLDNPYEKVVEDGIAPVGRLDVKLGSDAPWGSVCVRDAADGDEDTMSLATAATICRTMGFKSASTDNVLIIPSMGYHGIGMLALTSLKCSSVQATASSSMFPGDCSYVAALPKGRPLGSQGCSHIQDVGLHCEASIDRNVIDADFEIAIHRSKASVDQVVSKIASVASIRKDRVKMEVVHNDAADDYILVNISFLPRGSNDFGRDVSVSALNEFLMSISPSGLSNIFHIDQVVYDAVIRPTLPPTDSPTPVPLAEVPPSDRARFRARLVAATYSQSKFLAELGDFLSIPEEGISVISEEVIGDKIDVVFVVVKIPPPHNSKEINTELRDLAEDPTGLATLGIESILDLDKKSDRFGPISTAKKRFIGLMVFVVVFVGVSIHIMARTFLNRREEQRVANRRHHQDGGQHGEGRNLCPDFPSRSYKRTAVEPDELHEL